MKKILLITVGVFMLCNTNMKAQITLQYTLDSVTSGGQFYCTDLGNNDFKYVILDTFINGFHLYNMDMTPYMSVPIPKTYGKIYDYTVCYITKTLFDCDSTNIEFAYESPSNIYEPFYIFRTDGTLLFKADSSNAPYDFGGYGGSIDIRPIINTSDGTKLFLQYSSQKYGSGLRIYSLCGTLPEATNIYNFPHLQQQFVKIYPNPASNSLTFQINPPDNMNKYELVILDNNAKELRRENVGYGNVKLTIDVSNFSSGAYYYSLCTKSKAFQTGKFIITK